MTVLVTGAAGFVGSAVVRRFLAHGYAVRAMVRQTSDRRNLEGLEAEVVVGDLTDRPSLVRALRGCTGLCHVAADYRLWVRDPEPMFRTNVGGSRDVMTAAAEAGVTRMVHTSSVATLGILPGGIPADEETPVAYDDMIGFYKQSKFRAEVEVQRLITEESLPVVIVNPSTPVGPGDIRPTPTGRMIVEAASGRMPAYVDTGLNVVHVDDVAEGHVLAFEKGEVGQRYVLGGEDMALKDILRTIAEFTGGKPPRFSIPHDLIMPLALGAEAWARLSGRGEPFVTLDGLRMAKKKMFFSSAKAKNALGYQARPAADALADAVAWFRDHGYLD